MNLRNTPLIFAVLLFAAACTPIQLEESAHPLPTARATQSQAQTQPMSTTVQSDTVQIDTTQIDIKKPLPVGDPQRGAQLNDQKACSGCHFIGKVYVGPAWKAETYADNKGIGQRAEERWQQANYTGRATSATEYIFESIIFPNAYVIDGYERDIMPSAFGELLSEQDIADLIAFILTIK